MEYKLDQSGDAVTVVFTGDVTFSENAVFRQALKDVESAAPSSCVLDLSGVEMVDSAGLGMFLIAKDNADKANRKLSVKGATGHVASMLKLTKLSDLLG